MKSKSSKKTLEATSSAASSPGVSQRKHTPATIPRTKFTSATPLEQRIAINSLRQKLDYEEKEKVSIFKDIYICMPHFSVIMYYAMYYSQIGTFNILSYLAMLIKL